MLLSSSHATPLSPSLAVCTAAVGVCLIFIELNRPGRILFGASGVMAVLLAAGALIGHALRPWAVTLLLVAAVCLLGNWWRRVPPVLLGAGIFGLITALRFLCRASDPLPVNLGVAVLCGGSLGILGALLTGVARHARRLKAID